MNRRTLLLAPLLLHAGLTGRPGAAAAPAGPPRPGTPEEMALRALAALKEDRIDAFVATLHPEALARFKRLMLEIVAAAARERQEGQLLPLFAGIRSAAELEQLPPPRFFTAYWRGVSRHRPELKRYVTGADAELLGHVAEGAAVAHVVYRTSVSAAAGSLTRLNVVSLKRDGAAWRMLLTGEIEGMVQLLRQQRGNRRPEPGAADLQVLGQIREDAEGAESAHVVYRTTAPASGASLTRLYVLTVDREDPEWPVVGRKDWAELTRMLRQRFGRGR